MDVDANLVVVLAAHARAQHVAVCLEKRTEINILLNVYTYIIVY